MPRGTLGEAMLARLLTDTVVLRRGATVMAAQQCRYGTSAAAGGADGIEDAGEAGRMSLAVYGPPDMDIERGDMFAAPAGGAKSIFRVQFVAPVLASPSGTAGANTPVGVKAICEAQQ